MPNLMARSAATNAANVALLVAALALPLAIAGCNAPSQPSASGGGYNPEIQAEVEQSIAQSAAEASNALETLAMIQRARTQPIAPVMDDAGLPPELKRQATIGFTGPSVEIAKEIAQDIGYAFVVEGREPKSPGIISLDVKDEPVFRVLEDVGLQSSEFAAVVVDPNQKTVFFRYGEPKALSMASAGAQPAPPAPHVSHSASPKVAPKPRHHVKITPMCPCQALAQQAAAPKSPAPDKVAASPPEKSAASAGGQAAAPQTPVAKTSAPVTPASPAPTATGGAINVGATASSNKPTTEALPPGMAPTTPQPAAQQKSSTGAAASGPIPSGMTAIQSPVPSGLIPVPHAGE